MKTPRGYCWAGDKYFQNLYEVSKTSIQNWLKALEDNGYIKREVEFKEGGKEILHRYISLVAYPMQENLTTPIQENLVDNNTYINNTINNHHKVYSVGIPNDNQMDTQVRLGKVS